MNGRGTLRMVYVFLLVLAGLLFLAVMLSQIEMARRTAKAPALIFSVISFAWLSPGFLAILSAWRLWAAKGAALAFWVLVAPAYALVGYLAHAHPERFGGLIGGPWGLESVVRTGGGNMASAGLWLTFLILGLGGFMGIAALLFPKDSITDSKNGASAKRSHKRD